MIEGNDGEQRGEEEKKGDAPPQPHGKGDDFKSRELIDKRLQAVEQTLREEKKFAELFERACAESATMKDAMGKHVAEAVKKQSLVREAIAEAVKEDPKIIEAIEEAVSASDRKWYHKFLRAFGGKLKAILIFVGGTVSALLVAWLKKKLGI